MADHPGVVIAQDTRCFSVTVMITWWVTNTPGLIISGVDCKDDGDGKKGKTSSNDLTLLSCGTGFFFQQ